ncbi:MAG: hypothetical protein JRD89_21380 [Deltaproteobacteria bacterium]|nr:hypothetical protein [Deltaproteobacteria bacterium]
MENRARELRRKRRGLERQVCSSCRRRLLLVTPDLEQEVRAVLDGLDPDSRAAVDEEFEMHVVDRGLLPVLTLPDGAEVIGDRLSLEAFRRTVESAGPEGEQEMR